MVIDEILKKVQKELNLTQEQLARDLNVSFSMLIIAGRIATPFQADWYDIRLLDYCCQKGVSDGIVANLERLK